MGANASTRKISVVNDEQGGIIKISDSLAQRLTGQLERESQRTQHDATPEQPKVDQSNVPAPQDSPSISVPNDELKSPFWSFAEAGALKKQFKEEMALELSVKDEEWRERMRQRENDYVQMNKLNQEKVEESMKKIDGMFRKVSSANYCEDFQEAVRECYSNNPKQPLKCSQLVEGFSHCANIGSNFTKNGTVH